MTDHTRDDTKECWQDSTGRKGSRLGGWMFWEILEWMWVDVRMM